MSKLQGKVIGGFLLCGVIFSLAACGNGSESDVSGKKMFYSSINNSVEREGTETEADEYDISNENYKEGYLITKVNSVQETIQVYSYEDEAEYIYHYGMKSEFYNKYGNHAVVSDFSPGDVVSIDGTDEDGRITNISKSGDVWVYDDIVRFNTNPEDNVLTIADTKYDISDDTFIFSLEDRITLKDIAKDDVLCVVGAGTKILSVSVKTGHGNLKLENTSLFEGSYIQLNDDIFTEITPDMTMEIPEGTYTLTVANNGWGGSTNIAIVRGETTIVDLDTIKGEGPKKGTVKFVLDPEDAVLYIDGKEIKNINSVDMEYGNHKLLVKADGYKEYSCTLCVNSKASTIMLNLSKESESGESTTENNEAKAVSPDELNTNSEENTSTNSTEGTGSAIKDTSALSGMSDEELKDYLSTISSLVNSISS